MGKNQVEVEEEPVGREELELLGSGEAEVTPATTGPEFEGPPGETR